MTVAEALRIARDRIAKGWIQGKSYRAEPEGWCASGALRESHESPSISTCGGCGASRLLSEVTGADGNIPVWNDEPGRTQAEVLAAFDRAIALAEAA